MDRERIMMRADSIDFILDYIRLSRELEIEKEIWKQHLIEIGIKAAHPDDGWVDREINSVILVYPHFVSHNISDGDLIVLGHPDKYRIVKVVNIKKCMGGSIRLYFKPWINKIPKNRMQILKIKMKYILRKWTKIY